MRSLTTYEQFAREKDLCLKKPFSERNECFLVFHKRLVRHFLDFLDKLKTSEGNEETLKVLHQHITPFAIDEADIYFGLQTELNDIAWNIKEFLDSIIEKQATLEENKLQEIELAVQAESQSLGVNLYC